jgi:hypothetical protein
MNEELGISILQIALFLISHSSFLIVHCVHCSFETAASRAAQNTGGAKPATATAKQGGHKWQSET